VHMASSRAKNLAPRLWICGAILAVGVWYVRSGQAEVDDEQPLNGIAYNTKELSAVVYECDLAKSDRMACKFTQLAVRRAATQADLKKKLANLDKDLVKEKPSAKECAEMEEYFGILEGTVPAKAREPLKFRDPRDREQAFAAAKAYRQACKTGDVELLRNVARANYELETRTCRVSANNFEQTFKRVADTANGKFSWVVDSSPQGDCGIVQLSRFEPVTMEKLTFWNYVARKAITNPEGQTGLIPLKCSKLDETTYVYSWRSDEGLTWADCEKIEFGVF
jgi:hypothetical protein